MCPLCRVGGHDATVERPGGESLREVKSPLRPILGATEIEFDPNQHKFRLHLDLGFHRFRLEGASQGFGNRYVDGMTTIDNSVLNGD